MKKAAKIPPQTTKPENKSLHRRTKKQPAIGQNDQIFEKRSKVEIRRTEKGRVHRSLQEVGMTILDNSTDSTNKSKKSHEGR